MRTVKLHATVGYELPEHRDSCRHCKQVDGAYDDRPGFSGCATWTCKVHRFQVMLSGICPDFKRKGPTYRVPQAGERDDKTVDMFNRAA